jgi:hypothetical protein
MLSAAQETTHVPGRQIGMFLFLKKNPFSEGQISKLRQLRDTQHCLHCFFYITLLSAPTLAPVLLAAGR